MDPLRVWTGAPLVVRVEAGRRLRLDSWSQGGEFMVTGGGFMLTGGGCMRLRLPDEPLAVFGSQVGAERPPHSAAVPDVRGGRGG
eukprot:4164871-Pyramimonas_sp.AAC.1